jgi:hypothetical protein
MLRALTEARGTEQPEICRGSERSIAGRDGRKWRFQIPLNPISCVHIEEGLNGALESGQDVLHHFWIPFQGIIDDEKRVIFGRQTGFVLIRASMLLALFLRTYYIVVRLRVPNR